MCGIAGFVHRLDTHVDPLAAMLRRLAHRGPDGAGHWHGVDGDWQIRLGHRRLAIIDLECGAQPMANEDGSVQITFNGEIYNFAELRPELERRGHRFRTRSDTETVVHQFEEHGTAGLAALNGMFAFAIWDATRASLTLVRDRIGIKPLYYASLPDGGLAFASELTALLEHPRVTRELDPRGVASLLFRDYADAPNTVLRGVSKLPPGHSITWSNGRLGEPVPFWKAADAIAADAGGGRRDTGELIDELRDRLDRAVHAQLVADVPVGVFLSGGIDSSLVAALAARHVGPDLRTFSIGFDDAEYDESFHARRVARHIGSRHTERRFNDGDLLDVLDAAMESLDEPIADPSILPTFLLSQLAATHVKVALGGDGGDELWAGYPTYKAHRAARLYAAIPAGVRRFGVEPAIASLPVAHGYQRLDWKLKRFALRWMNSPIHRHQHWMAGASVDDLRAAMPNIDVPWLESPVRDDAGDRLNRILAFDLTTYLPGSVLTKVDRASMAHGLEVRPRLLGNALIDFALALPSGVKLRRGTSKWLLKRAAVGLLPRDILMRRKKGFGVPLARWMRSQLRPRIDRILDDSPLWSHRMLRREAIVDWNAQHQAGRHDYSRPLWAILALDHWLRRLPGAA